MGSCSAKISAVYSDNPAFEALKPQFLAMGVTQSKLSHFHKHFKTIDKSNDGVVTVPQMIAHFKFDNNEFIRKAFSVLVSNKEKETLDFRDFVITIWNYCTLEEDFGLFVFGVYDFDGNKELDHEEAVELMKDLYGSEKKNEDFVELTARILKQKKMGAFGVQEYFFKQ
jgi:Ca2+-binding EF-hand superfamily protein